MAGSAFYDAGPLEQVAINLFHGWGYNFYRKENQLRADDQLVRARVGALLASARKSVEKAESDYRREHLPPPTREKPTPDPAAVAGAQALERLAHGIGDLQGLMTAQPAPENDRMTQRYRREAETLQRLIAGDQRLVGQSELLRSMLDQKNGEWMLANLADLKEGLAAISETLRQRHMELFGAT
ncbi:MAG TPA: hypothetical protein VHY22_05930 [Chthoniobacteraceae bacterium]|jgi:hypothetical protein|nr:hypothetical protein [Chthoniobacteraceae bacterium]